MGHYLFINHNWEVLERFSGIDYGGDWEGREIYLGATNLEDAYAAAEYLTERSPNVYSEGIKISEQAVQWAKTEALNAEMRRVKREQSFNKVMDLRGFIPL